MPTSNANDRRPDLSIVTISYSDPAALKRTLQSLAPLRASSLKIEHVVVDSSTELNQPVLASHPSPGTRIHVPQRPLGIYSAMNEGIRQSKGKVLWFLNSGDCLASAEALQHAISRFSGDKEASMLLAAAALTRNGLFLYEQRARIGLRPLLGINRVCHQAMLFRSEVFSKLGHFQESYRLAADYELHLRALHARMKIITFNEVIVNYDLDGQSASSSAIFFEFRRIQNELLREGVLSHPRLHFIYWVWERVRIAVFKRLGRSFLGAPLKRAWKTYRAWIR